MVWFIRRRKVRRNLSYCTVTYVPVLLQIWAFPSGLSPNFWNICEHFRVVQTSEICLSFSVRPQLLKYLWSFPCDPNLWNLDHFRVVPTSEICVSISVWSQLLKFLWAFPSGPSPKFWNICEYFRVVQTSEIFVTVSVWSQLLEYVWAFPCGLNSWNICELSPCGLNFCNIFERFHVVPTPGISARSFKFLFQLLFSLSLYEVASLSHSETFLCFLLKVWKC